MAESRRWPLLCPKCGEEASQENYDRARTDARDLTCHICHERRFKLAWTLAGLKKFVQAKMKPGHN